MLVEKLLHPPMPCAEISALALLQGPGSEECLQLRDALPGALGDCISLVQGVGGPQHAAGLVERYSPCFGEFAQRLAHNGFKHSQRLLTFTLFREEKGAG